MKFSIKDFFNKFDQIRRKLRIWSRWLNKTLLKNFIFCVVVMTAIRLLLVNQFQPSIALHMETSHFVGSVNQVTGFYEM